MEQEEMLMYQESPYFGDDASRYHGWYGYEPYGWYDYGYPYWYGHGWGHHGWGHHGGGHHGWHRDDDDMVRRMPMPCPMPMPMQPLQPMPMQPPLQPMPMQPIMQPTEKKYSEIKSLEKNVNITEINNTIIKIEQKHPYIMKKLLMLGLAYGECRKLIYLTLLCSGKFDL